MVDNSINPVHVKRLVTTESDAVQRMHMSVPGYGAGLMIPELDIGN